MLGLTPNSGNVSDYFDCSSDPFPPTGFPRPALMRGFVRGLNWSCGMFYLCPLEVFSSLGEKAEVEGGDRRSGRRQNCSSDTLFKRKINYNEIIIKLRNSLH